MRLKAYTAATVAEALQQIREELGEDATIVATDSEGDRVRVVAAIDAEEAPAAPVRPVPRPVVWPTAAEKPAPAPPKTAPKAPERKMPERPARAPSANGVGLALSRA